MGLKLPGATGPAEDARNGQQNARGGGGSHPAGTPGHYGGAGGGADAQDRASEREASAPYPEFLRPLVDAPAPDMDGGLAPFPALPLADLPAYRMAPSPPPPPPPASAPTANVRNDGVPAHFKAMPEERLPHERTADRRRMDNDQLGRAADTDDPDAVRAVLLALLCNQSDMEKERMRMDALRHLLGLLERNEINVTLYLKAARIVLYQGWVRIKPGN
jgi:hypothetical protein